MYPLLTVCLHPHGRVPPWLIPKQTRFTDSVQNIPKYIMPSSFVDPSNYAAMGHSNSTNLYNLTWVHAHDEVKLAAAQGPGLYRSRTMYRTVS